MTPLIQGLFEEWKKVKSSVTGAPSQSDVEVRPLRELLQRFVNAGTTVTDIAERAQLQRVATEIGDTIHRCSDLYPQTVIAPPGEESARAVQSVRVSLGALSATGEHLFGRGDVLTELDAAWENAGTNVVILVGLGGVGKSTLVSHWLSHMAGQNWQGAEQVFGWTFSGLGASNAFFRSALPWFGGNELEAGAAPETGRRLGKLIREKRTLLILDGVELLQFPPGPTGGAFKDMTVQALVQAIASPEPPWENGGLCVITTRQTVPESALCGETTARQIELENLPTAAGVELLTARGVTGRPEELVAAVTELDGHALALNVLGSYLRDAFNGDVTRRRNLAILDTELPEGAEARAAMALYETWLREGPQLETLRLTGMFNRPANADELAILRSKPAIMGLTDAIVPLTHHQWNATVAYLRRSGLLAHVGEDEPHALDVHPLVRHYFRNQVRDKFPEGWRAGHQRLFKYHSEKAPPMPSTARELEPLFDAVFHGCNAGHPVETLREVMQRRILRWNQNNPRFLSTNTLGLWGETLSAIQLFFKTCWSEVLDDFKNPGDKAFIFTSAGTCLRALYRFDEAIEAMTRGYELRLKHEEWSEASFALRMINQTHIAAGSLKEATESGKRSVELADQGGKLDYRVSARVRYGESLHHCAANMDEMMAARRQFEDALALWHDQRPRPQANLLDGFSEFEYCDLLLTLGDHSSAKERAEGVREWAEDLCGREPSAEEHADRQPLWAGLSRVILGKVDLAAACHLAEGSPERARLFDCAREHFKSALRWLRGAKEQQHVPLGDLALANLDCEVGQLDEAEGRLKEVLAIASASRMRLHMTDCHLISARCALRRRDKDAADCHRTAASNLIRETGYRRRDKELLELEEVTSTLERG